MKEKILNRYNESKKEIHLYIVVVLVFIIMSALNGHKFLNVANLKNMSIQMTECGTLALGVALAMIAGGIDLSVVGVADLTGIVVALILSRMVPEGASDTTIALYMCFALLTGLLIAVACGYFNGVVVARFHVPAILATMGTMEMFKGIAIVITEGKAVGGMVDAFSDTINAQLFGFLPMPFLLFMLAALFVSWLLNKTKYGKNLYMVGTNIKAARYSGINCESVLITTHVIASVLAFVGGMIMAGRINSAKADVGSSYTFQCILICILGGVKNTGGFGKVSGLVAAIVALQMVSTGLGQMRSLGFNNYYRSLLWGILLLIMLVFNVVNERRRDRQYQRLASNNK